MKGVWKEVPGYGGRYIADTEGNVKRICKNGKERMMTPYHKKRNGSQKVVVKMTKDGKSREVPLMQIIAKTFLGEPKEGEVPYHKNGCQSDNYLNNIGYMDRRSLGKMTGAKARRRPVAKINKRGEIIEVYSSAREAARKNYMSRQTVNDRCNGKTKMLAAPDGYMYAWEDSEVSMRRCRTIQKK